MTEPRRVDVKLPMIFDRSMDTVSARTSLDGSRPWIKSITVECKPKVNSNQQLEVVATVCFRVRGLAWVIIVNSDAMATFDTIFPADSVEFSPHPNMLDIFVCGTYKLDEASSTTTLASEESNKTSSVSPQSRRGKCLVFRVEPSLSPGGRGL